jgi:hypothetical protein
LSSFCPMHMICQTEIYAASQITVDKIYAASQITVFSLSHLLAWRRRWTLLASVSSTAFCQTHLSLDAESDSEASRSAKKRKAGAQTSTTQDESCTSFVWLTLEFGRPCNELTLLIYAGRRASSSRSRVVQVLQAGVGSSCHPRTHNQTSTVSCTKHVMNGYDATDDLSRHKALAFDEPCAANTPRSR